VPTLCAQDILQELPSSIQLVLRKQGLRESGILTDLVICAQGL
jgi:hypothetical protein